MISKLDKKMRLEQEKDIGILAMMINCTIYLKINLHAAQMIMECISILMIKLFNSNFMFLICYGNLAAQSFLQFIIKHQLLINFINLLRRQG